MENIKDKENEIVKNADYKKQFIILNNEMRRGFTNLHKRFDYFEKVLEPVYDEKIQDMIHVLEKEGYNITNGKQ